MARAEEMAEEKSEEMFNYDSFCLNGWEPSILREFVHIYILLNYIIGSNNYPQYRHSNNWNPIWQCINFVAMLLIH